MLNILIKSVVTVLVIYAVIDIVKNFAFYLVGIKKGAADNVFIAIKVKNNQEHLEGIVRRIIWQQLKLSNGGYIPTILIVDMGSTDETRKIALKMCDDYDFIYYTTEDEYIKIKGNKLEE